MLHLGKYFIIMFISFNIITNGLKYRDPKMKKTNTIKVFNKKHLYILNPLTFRSNKLKPLNISFKLYNTITVSYCRYQIANTYSLM